MNTTIPFSQRQPFHPANPALALWRALSSEGLKMKRTLALGLTLIAPALIIAMNFMIMLERGTSVLEGTADSWSFYNRQNLIYWALLMQPLFITLETALVAQLDHANDHWKHLFALPIPRWAIYSAKQIINTMLILLSMVFLFGYTLLSGLLLRWLRPGIGFEAAPPLQGMFFLTMLAFLSSWLVISIHHWVAMRWHSFVVACSFGIGMTITGITVINSALGQYYPWTLTTIMLDNFVNGLPYLSQLALGSLGGVLFAFLGFLRIRHRDVL